MRKSLRKSLSALLVVVMMVTAVPLQGFVGLELPDWNFGWLKNIELPKFNGFDVEAEAASEWYTVDGIVGGQIQFDKATGTITDGENSITIANIPTTIDGVSVTSIGDTAFYSCNNLTSITIPDSVTSIGYNAFYRCSSLTSINVSSYNKFYSSANGVLFNKNKTLLIKYLEGKTATSYTIPNSVTIIGYSAFEDCSSLTSVTIGDSVMSIGYWAFDSCVLLEEITLPNSITTLGCSIFSNTPKLKEINYPLSLKSCDHNSNYGPFGGSSIETVTIPDGVTAIPNYTFYGATKLKNIDLPDSVESIGSSAFIDCSSLTSVTIPDSVTSIGSNAFSYCDKLENVIIPDSVTNIGTSAFSSCRNLTSVTIGDSVESIGGEAFYNCDNLKIVTIGDSVDSIGEDSFYGTAWYNNQPNGLVYAGKVVYKYKGTMPRNTSIIIKDGTLGIADYAFYGDDGLESVIIPDSVTSIGSNAFSYCDKLENVIIPNSVTNIGSDAFEDCDKLESVTIGDRVEIIGDRAFYGTAWYNNQPNGLVYAGKVVYKYKGTMPKNTSIIIKDGTLGIVDYAFYGDDGLVNISIPNSVTNIGKYAFYFCSNLTSITIPYGVTRIGDYTFYSCTSLTNITIPDCVTSIGRSAFEECTKLTNITIPDSVTFIGPSAFGGCDRLTSITIPDSVTNLNYGVFAGCGIIRITIPDNVTSIGEFAFSNCVSLVNVTIGDGVTSLDNHAFHYCYNLESITISNSVRHIGNFAFYRCHRLTTVYYDGIEEEWQKIGMGNDNYYLINANIIYNANSNWYEVPGVVGGKIKFDKNTGTILDAEEGIVVATLPNEIEGVEIKKINGGGHGIVLSGENGFDDCRNIQSITIPKGVTNYEPNCSALGILDNISVSSQNPVYSSVDGVLLNKDKTSLKVFPIGKTLNDYEVAETVTSIDASAFNYSTHLQVIRIPDSVTEIGDGAFYGCNALETVYYEGSESQWSNIDIGDNNDALLNAEIIFGAKDIVAKVTEINSNTIMLEDKLYKHELEPDVVSSLKVPFYALVAIKHKDTENEKVVGLKGLATKKIIDVSNGVDLTESFDGFAPSSKYNSDSDSYVTYELSEVARFDKGFLTKEQINIKNYLRVSYALVDEDTNKFYGVLNDPENFNPNIYKANKGLINEQWDLGTQLSGFSYFMFDEDMDFATNAWNAITAAFDSLSDPTTIADLATERKDMYKGMIFNMLEQSTWVDMISKAANTSLSYANDYLNGAKVIEEFLDEISPNIKPVNLTKQERKTIIDKFKDSCSDLDIIDKLDGILQIAQTTEEVVSTYSLIYTANTLNSVMKDVFSKMAEYASTSAADDEALNDAISEVSYYMQLGTRDLLAEIMSGTSKIVGGNAVKYGVSKLYGFARDSFLAANPALKVWSITYDIAKAGVNVVFNTDQIVDYYNKMYGINTLEQIGVKTSDYFAEKYIANESDENSKLYHAAYCTMLDLKLQSTETAEDLVKNVDSSLANKITDAFSTQDGEKVALASIQKWKENFTAPLNDVTKNWYHGLQYDYPNSGIYEQCRQTGSWSSSARQTIACPVDVFVYDKNDNLMASIVDNEIVEFNDQSMTVMVEDDVKTLYYDKDKDYRIEYIGNDAGKMDIEIIEYDNSGNVNESVKYYDLPLNDGKEYSSITTPKAADKNIIKDENNEKITPNANENETTTSYKVTMIDSLINENSQYVESGNFIENERVFIEAIIPEGYSFNGWKSDNNVIFDNENEVATYFIMKNSDTVITANLIKDDIAHEHSWSDWKITKQPTCTKAGEETRYCNDCDETETRKVNALGHDFSTQFTIDSKASCTQVGSKSKHCSRCDEVTDVTEISMTPHVIETVPGKSATCTSHGSTDGQYCKVCNLVLVESELMPMLEHKDENEDGKCDYCGKELENEDDSNDCSVIRFCWDVNVLFVKFFMRIVKYILEYIL